MPNGSDPCSLIFKPNILAESPITRAKRQEKSRELMEGIIQAKTQDNKLIYQNCITERIPTMFERELARIDSSIGKLSLDYEIEID